MTSAKKRTKIGVIVTWWLGRVVFLIEVMKGLFDDISLMNSPLRVNHSYLLGFLPLCIFF